MTTLTTWTRREPFAQLDGLDALVRRSFGPMTVRTPVRPAGFVPAAEVVRDGDDAVVRLELPGVDVERDVTVELDRGRLVVSGERRDERTDVQRSLREVRYGRFTRTFTLPEHVTGESLSATYDAGVLSVRVAGAHVGREPQRVAITVAQPAEQPAEQAEQEGGQAEQA